MKNTFWEFQDIRAGKKTHRLIAGAASVVIIIIVLVALIVAAVLTRIMLTLDYSSKLPSGFPIFAIPRPEIPTLLTFLQIWTWILIAAFIYVIATALKWGKRFYDDRYFDEFRSDTERKLKKLNGSLTEISADDMNQTDPEGKSTLESLGNVGDWQPGYA